MNIIQNMRDHSFFGKLIDENSVVVDLGAHQGEFSEQISKTYGCRCFAIEASPDLCQKINQTEKIKKFNLAIADKNGEVDFYLSDFIEANSIFKEIKDLSGFDKVVRVRSSTLERFVKEQGMDSIDLLKVDIEGAEILLFDSMDDVLLQKIAQITIEFHDFIKELGIEEKVRKIKQRLQRSGFFCIEVRRPHDNFDVLFINLRNKKLRLKDKFDLFTHKHLKLRYWYYLKRKENFFRSVIRYEQFK